jgi:hypothetical protein
MVHVDAGSRPRAGARPPRTFRGMRPGVRGSILHSAAHHHPSHGAQQKIVRSAGPPRRSLPVALRTMPLLPAMGASLGQIRYPRLTQKDIRVALGMTAVWLGYFSLSLL